MNGSCNGCGDCCAVVVLGTEWSKAKARAEVGVAREQVRWHGDPAWRDRLADLEWRVRLKRISLTEAKRRLPSVGRGSTYWECPNFDYSSRRCLDYENRPPVCRNFPWYGRDPDDPGAGSLRAFPRCGYRIDKIERLRDWAPAHGTSL